MFNIVLNTVNFDPTRTTLLRRKMISVLRARFNLLRSSNAYNRNLIESSIAGHMGTLLPFVQTAFITGVKRSYTEARRGLIAAGSNLEGGQAEFLRLMSGLINHQSADLADRLHNDLQNIASDLNARIRRVVLDGKRAGYSQQQVRKLINSEISKKFNHAISAVQTEVTRSHADGQLAAYERLGVRRVGVLVEWTNPNSGVSAKGNPSPCKLCKPVVGVTFTLKEAKGLIPRHVNCMCSFTLVSVRTPQQIRQKREIQRAIQRSLKAEGNRTTWSGAKRKIARRK